MKLHPQYLTDIDGKKVAVVLPISEYQELLEDIEDLATVAKRKNEVTMKHEDFLSELKKDGLL